MATVLYLLVSLLVTQAVWVDPFGMLIGGVQTPDLMGTLWCYWWTGAAVSEGLSPFQGAFNYFPVGHAGAPVAQYNLFDAAVAAPFLFGFGRVFGSNLFILAVMVSTGLGAHALSRTAGASHHGAAIGGVTILLSQFLAIELLAGRISQIMLVVWFLSLAGLIRLAQGRRRPHEAVLTGLGVGVSFLIYWYAGAFLILAAVPFWIVPTLGGKWSRLKALGIAALTCIVVTSPAFLSLAMAFADLPGVDRSVPDDFQTYGWMSRGEVGLTMAIRHSHWPWWPFIHTPAELADHQVANVAMLLAGLGLLVIGWGRVQWALLLVLGFCLPMGPYLVDSGLNPLKYALPYLYLYEWVPFWERLWWPDRLVLLFYAALVPLAAVGADRLILAIPRLRAPIALLLVLAVGYDSWELNRQLPIRAQAPPAVELAVLEGLDGPVLTPPILGQREEQRWHLWLQMIHQQPISGGLGDHISDHRPPGFEDYVESRPALLILNELLEPSNARTRKLEVDPTEIQQLLDDGFRWVLVDEVALNQYESSVVDAHTWVFTQLWGEPELTSTHTSAWRIQPIQRRVNLSRGLRIAAQPAGRSLPNIRPLFQRGPNLAPKKAR